MFVCMDRFCKTTYYLTLCLTQTILYWSLTYGKSIRIDMKTDPSVYPCLDTFDILMTTPNLTDEKYIRVIRVYTSNHTQRYYVNTLKLNYVREYKLPMNNYLKIDCHFFDSDFRYYCFVFVALSRTTGAVLINGRPHCRPTAMQWIVSSTASALLEDTINSLSNDNSLEQLRPAGPSYKYNYPTKTIANNIYGKSRRVSTGSKEDNENRLDDSFLDLYSDEQIAHYISINCKCSDSYDIESNVSTVIISLGIVMCNNDNNNDNQNNNNNYLSDNTLQDSNEWKTSSDYDLFDKNDLKRNYMSSTAGDSKHSTHSADTNSNSDIFSSICILNLTEGDYKMKVQYEMWTNIPVIYVRSTHIPQLVVREGRLSIDPQLDINNKSQIHSLKSRYLRIESFYTQNLTIKLLLVKSTHFLVERNAFFVFLSTLTPIHFTSMALIVVIGVCLLALILISLTSPQRKTVVKIMTPSEEGEQTRTSYMDPTDIMSQFSLPDDNQSLEMDYYDYLLPFVPRPHSRAVQTSEVN